MITECKMLLKKENGLVEFSKNWTSSLHSLSECWNEWYCLWFIADGVCFGVTIRRMCVCVCVKGGEERRERCKTMMMEKGEIARILFWTKITAWMSVFVWLLECHAICHGTNSEQSPTYQQESPFSWDSDRSPQNWLWIKKQERPSNDYIAIPKTTPLSCVTGGIEFFTIWVQWHALCHSVLSALLREGCPEHCTYSTIS